MTTLGDEQPLTHAFRTVVSPSRDRMHALEQSCPANPFCTAAYARARSLLGETPVLFTVSGGSGTAVSFYGFLRRARIGHWLEIPSTPALDRWPAFADGLTRFCSDNGVKQLELNTYGSPTLALPPIRGERRRYARTEFVVDLATEPLLAGMAKGHRYPIRRAQRAGLTLRRSTSDDACVEHARVMSLSMTRRESRGESVSTEFPIEPLLALLHAGAGELFQVVDGEHVLSSMLLLRSRLAAYDHTSGSSPDGMEAGAPKLAVLRACEELRHEGCLELNLGGVRQHESGLRTFKEHFGARAVEMEAVVAEYHGPMLRLARGAVRLVRGMVRSREAGADVVNAATRT